MTRYRSRHHRQLDEEFARLPDAAGVPAEPELRHRVLRPAGAQRADAVGRGAGPGSLPVPRSACWPAACRSAGRSRPSSSASCRTALGKRKILLVIATIGFSLCSFLSGLATSFVFLFAARLLMGAAEGGVMPISHAMVASEVNPAPRAGAGRGAEPRLQPARQLRRPGGAGGLATQCSAGARRSTLPALPGLLSAALIWFMLREPAPRARQAGGPKLVSDVLSGVP
jgi:hypothetical protein